jgi:hypothetical protein
LSPLLTTGGTREKGKKGIEIGSLAIPLAEEGIARWVVGIAATVLGEFAACINDNGDQQTNNTTHVIEYLIKHHSGNENCYTVLSKQNMKQASNLDCEYLTEFLRKFFYVFGGKQVPGRMIHENLKSKIS